MKSILEDLRYGFRMLAKRPGFTLIAVLALALGVGANTAVFSVIRGVLLRPLPYADPARLVVLWESNLQAAAPRESTSPPNFKDWREQNQCFEGMAAMAGGAAVLTEEGEPELLSGSTVTADFFDLLGVKPAVGPGFTPESTEQDVVLLSDALWERRFGREANIVGRRIRLNGTLQTIVGVMPAAFRSPSITGIQSAEIWRPFHASDLRAGRRSDFMRVYARLKRGISVNQARAEMTAISQRLARQYPADNAAWTLEVVPLSDAISGNVRQPLWLLLGSAALLLLIACANVANLSLARATERRREFAIRAALGGGKTRLVRQLLTESFALALIGGTAGIALGAVAMKAILQIGSDFVPRAADVRLDWAVMLFGFAVAGATALLFGTLPALQAGRVELNESLKSGGRGTTAGGGRRALLVVAEVGLAFVLLISAGLLLRSFWSVGRVPLGFEPANLLTASLRLPVPPNGQGDARTVQFLGEFLQRIERLPGVVSAAAISGAPLTGAGHNSFVIEGRPVPGDDVIQDAVLNAVTPGYFRTMRIALKSGRSFTPADSASAPKVAVINETMARRYFPAEDPLRHRISFDGAKFFEIIGVVADVHDEGVTVEPMPQVYWVHAQAPFRRMAIVVRANLDPLALVSGVRAELRAMDKDRPLSNVATAEALRAQDVAPRRFALTLLAGFAGLALLVAAIGIYGVISFSVTERTQEFGIRMALGAGRRDVLGMVLVRGLRFALIGISAGGLIAFAATRVLGSFLFGVTAHDPVTFLSVAGIFALVAVAACLVPAHRATKVDPMVALRYE